MITRLFLIGILLLNAAPAWAVTIDQVTSPKGIKAWLVEDHKLPLIAIQFAFRGGVEQDPAAKQGLANLTMNLLTQGAGPYDASAFQQEMADHSIVLRFSASRDSLVGSAKFLTADRDKAVELMHLSLTAPRFDEKDIERERGQQLSSLRVQLGSSDWQARYGLFQYIFGTHPYGMRRLGTTDTLAAIKREDIQKFPAQHFARDNLIIGVTGDIAPKDLAIILDNIFGDLPEKATLAPIADVVWPEKNAAILVERDGTQTDLLFALPGPKRDDPDWYAAEIANYILGGGSFSSRLMQDVREKKGLTYGVSTSLSPADHGGMVAGGASTDNPKTGQAWAVMMRTMKKLYQDGATEAEITSAEDYLTGALPLALTSTDKIAGILVDMQLDNLGKDYLDRRNDLIRQVKAEDVKRALKRWFNPEKIHFSMVGRPEGMLPTKTQDMVRN